MAGEHNLRLTSGKEQERDVSYATHHPDWNSYTLDFDVSVVRLSTPFSFNGDVGPACRPSGDWTTGNSIVSGWGTLSAGKESFMEIIIS